MRIPSNNIWRQTNEGDIFGVLHSTKNITLDDRGKITLSKRPVVVYNSVDDSGGDPQLKDIYNILYFNGDYYVTTHDGIFKGSLTTGTFAQIAGDPNVLPDLDAVVFNGKYHVSTDGGTTADVSSHDTSDTWADGVLPATLTTGIPHPMAIFEDHTHKLAVADGNILRLYAADYTLFTDTLTLPTEHQIQTMRYRNGFMYIGTKNLNGGEAKVFIWKGSGTGIDAEVPTGASWVYSMTPWLSSVACMTSQGQLLHINGVTAQQIGALPVYYKQDVRWQGTGTDRMFNRSMTTVGTRIYMMINGGVDVGSIHEMKGGMWVYETDTGLTHRATNGTDRIVNDASISLSSNEITTSATHNLKKGDVVMFSVQGSLTGIDNDVPYYVSVTGTSTLKLARSRKALQAGITMTIGGTVSSAQFLYTPNTDFGDEVNSRASAIAPTVYNESMEVIWQSEVVWGSHVNNKTTGGSLYAINVFSDTFNVGGFETQRIYTNNILETWNKLYTYLEGLELDVEEFIVKYRTDTKEETPRMNGTWGANNKIHSDASTFDEDNWEDIEVGWEVVIVDKTGRGQTAHITDIETSSNTFVLTLDETFGVDTESVIFYATNYKKEKKHTRPRANKAFIESTIDQKGSWIQFKVEMRGFQTSVSFFDLSNSADKSSI